jgi:WhiB family redox-sensing transcriptional regulator
MPPLADLLREIYVTSGHGSPVPCVVGDSDLWFSDDRAQVEEAKEGCRQCPLILPCLEGALSRREVRGVWGGEELRRGQIYLARRRSKGRGQLTRALVSRRF